MYGTIEYAQLIIPIYLNLFERAQALMKRFNPCNVCDGMCERERRGKGKSFCCEGCVYLGPDGCRVKALRCSLWICREDLIHEDNRRAFNSEMWNIMIVADKYHLLVPRGSMEDSIAQAAHYYTTHKHERPILIEEAKAYSPAPLFFREALRAIPRPRTFEATNSFAAYRSLFSEGRSTTELGNKSVLIEGARAAVEKAVEAAPADEQKKWVSDDSCDFPEVGG